jgi:hypothetical protein
LVVSENIALVEKITVSIKIIQSFAQGATHRWQKNELYFHGFLFRVVSVGCKLSLTG